MEQARLLRARHQSANLKSDMQAFKAANPGCALGDFVRWHSPRDWLVESPPACADGSNGRLSERFDEPGNLWVVLWEVTLPMAASQQRPLNETSHERSAADVAREEEEAQPAAPSWVAGGRGGGGWGWGGGLLGGVAAAATSIVAESAGGLKQLATDVGSAASVAGRDVVKVAAVVTEMVASDVKDAADSSAALSALSAEATAALHAIKEAPGAPSASDEVAAVVANVAAIEVAEAEVAAATAAAAEAEEAAEEAVEEAEEALATPPSRAPPPGFGARSLSDGCEGEGGNGGGGGGDGWGDDDVWGDDDDWGDDDLGEELDASVRGLPEAMTPTPTAPAQLAAASSAVSSAAAPTASLSYSGTPTAPTVSPSPAAALSALATAPAAVALDRTPSGRFGDGSIGSLLGGFVGESAGGLKQLATDVSGLGLGLGRQVCSPSRACPWMLIEDPRCPWMPLDNRLRLALDHPWCPPC